MFAKKNKKMKCFDQFKSLERMINMKKNNDISNRKSNIELLRIIAMIMIIAHHYCLYGGWSKVSGLSINNAILDFLVIGGKIGVAIFVLISGYFGINSEFKIKKLINTVLQVLFYSILFGLLNIIIDGWVGWKAFIKICLPITFSVYWFITVYCILYLISPYINKVIRILNKKEFIKLLLIMGILSCGVITTILKPNRGFGSLFIFVFLYILGAYINTYYNGKHIKYSLLISIFFYFLIFASQLLFEAFIPNYVNYFIDLTSLPIIACAIFMLLGFKELEVESKVINTISSATFGVYLIHENTYVRPFIWQKVFKNYLFYSKSTLFLHAIVCIIITMIICTIIELMRKRYIEKNTTPIVYKMFNILIIKSKNIVNKIKEGKK